MKKNLFTLMMFVLALTLVGSAIAQSKSAQTIKLKKQNVTFKISGKSMKGVFMASSPIFRSGGDACTEEGKTTTQTFKKEGTCRNALGVDYACSCDIVMEFICTDGKLVQSSDSATSVCTATAKLDTGVVAPMETQMPDGN